MFGIPDKEAEPFGAGAAGKAQGLLVAVGAAPGGGCGLAALLVAFKAEGDRLAEIAR